MTDSIVTTPETRPADPLAIFGRRLSLLRTGRGLGQAELALRVGLARASIANMEAGRQNTGLRQLVTLADALDVSISVLVGDQDHELLASTRARVEEWERLDAEARAAVAAAAAAKRRIPRRGL